MLYNSWTGAHCILAASYPLHTCNDVQRVLAWQNARSRRAFRRSRSMRGPLDQASRHEACAHSEGAFLPGLCCSTNDTWHCCQWCAFNTKTKSTCLDPPSKQLMFKRRIAWQHTSTYRSHEYVVQFVFAWSVVDINGMLTGWNVRLCLVWPLPRLQYIF